MEHCCAISNAAKGTIVAFALNLTGVQRGLTVNLDGVIPRAGSRVLKRQGITSQPLSYPPRLTVNPTRYICVAS